MPSDFWCKNLEEARTAADTAGKACGRSAVLIVGDLSGIQRFIYSVAEPEAAAGGIARRLRARSLHLSVLCLATCRYLCHEFSVPEGGVLSSSGGNFMLVAPAQRLDSSALNRFRAYVEKWLWSNTWGELCLNVGNSKPFDVSDQASFGQALSEAYQDLATRKARPWSHIAGQQVALEDGCFEGSTFGVAYGRECASCRRLPALANEGDDDAQRLCRMCHEQSKVGQSIVKGSCGIRFVDPDEGDLSVLGCDIRVVQDAGGADDVPPTYAPTFEELGVPLPEGAESSDVADFDAHAERALGANKIAVLAADVDNLGIAMSAPNIGFEKKLALSRALTDFFGDRLVREHVGAGNGSTPCYLFYAGGDDVMVLGGWDRVLELAGELQYDFQNVFESISNELGLDLPLTISAGIAIDGPHTPVPDIAARAHGYLERAKESGEPRGNRIQVGDVCCSWGVYRRLLKVAWYLHQRTELPESDDNAVSRTFLHSLYGVVDLCDQYIHHGTPEGLRYKALLVAAMERNDVPPDVRELFNALLCADSEFTRAFRLCLDWVSLAGREKERG